MRAVKGSINERDKSNAEMPNEGTEDTPVTEGLRLYLWSSGFARAMLEGSVKHVPFTEGSLVDTGSINTLIKSVLEVTLQYESFS
jgi:hypothetical protein